MDAENNIVSLVSGKSDAEIADDLKKRMIEAFQPILKLSDEAKKDGFEITVATGVGPFGLHQIMAFKIVKVF